GTGAEPEPGALRREGSAAYQAPIAPAFRRLHRFFVEQYLPRARETIALSDLPDGEAWYAFNVRQSTTTSLTPREIHEIGVQEVRRIRARMDTIVRESGFGGDFPAFME